MNAAIGAATTIGATLAHVAAPIVTPWLLAHGIAQRLLNVRPQLMHQQRMRQRELRQTQLIKLINKLLMRVGRKRVGVMLDQIGREATRQRIERAFGLIRSVISQTIRHKHDPPVHLPDSRERRVVVGALRQHGGGRKRRAHRHLGWSRQRSEFGMRALLKRLLLISLDGDRGRIKGGRAGDMKRSILPPAADPPDTRHEPQSAIAILDMIG